MKNVRVFYNKTGDIKYISHLDMNRVFTRLLRRSGLPIWYTVGFNPHPKMNFALPLSLGFESESEIIDIRIEPDDFPCDEVAKQLSAVMPKGLTVKYAADPVMKVTEIAYARFLIETDGLPDLTDFFAQQTIITDKRTKSGTKPTDIRPMIKDYEINGNNLVLILSAGAINLNPTLVLSTAAQYVGAEINPIKITRTNVFDSNMKNFH